MPILAERSQVAIKSEAVAGTAETLAAADVILTTDIPTFEPDVQVTERAALSASLSQRGHVIGSRAATIGFKLHYRGTVGAPVDPTNLSEITRPLRGCGMQVTVSGTTPNEQAEYKPNSSFKNDETSGPYSTIAIFNDGKKYQIHGAVGNCVMTFAVGAPVVMEFTFTGVMDTPVDAALLVPTYPALVEPPFLGAALSILGFTTAKIGQLTLDLGNEIVMRPRPNLDGWHTAQIVRTRPRGTFDPEEELAATKNLWTEWLNGTTGLIDTGVTPSNGSNYNQFRFQIPKAQYATVGFEERDGIRTAPVEYVAQANSDAGDDDISLIQT